MDIKIKKLYDSATTPTKSTEKSAGFDLYACIETAITILPDNTVLVPLGFATEIPEGYFGAVYARSGLATKYGIRPANCVAVIDADYRGEWKVPLHNDGNEPFCIHNGDRIAQVVFQECSAFEFKEVEKLDETERGEGGFGSTGTNAVIPKVTEEQINKIMKEHEHSDKQKTSALNFLCKVIAEYNNVQSNNLQRSENKNIKMPEFLDNSIKNPKETLFSDDKVKATVTLIKNKKGKNIPRNKDGKLWCFTLHNKNHIYLDKVLVDFNGMPIFFICINEKEQYYVCYCYDMEDLKYIVTEISVSHLCSLIRGEYSFRDAVIHNNMCFDIITFQENEEFLCDIVVLKPASHLPEEILPYPNTYYDHRLLADKAYQKTIYQKMVNEMFRKKRDSGESNN